MSVRPIVRSAAIAVAAIASAIAFSNPAHATEGGCGVGGVLTVHVSDSTPASGEQFVVRGKLDFFGMSSADYVVKVQTHRGGSWEPIKGARVLTDDDGHYRLRLVLGHVGTRQMRVVAVGKMGDPNMHDRFHVTVH